MFKRTQTRPIHVGPLQIGGQNQVIVQSMTNTPTKNVAATVEQIRRQKADGSGKNGFYGCRFVKHLVQ